MVRTKFNLELIANLLVIGIAIKLLCLNLSNVIAYKINPNLILYGFIILFLLISVIKDIGRLLIAIFAIIGLIVLLFNKIALFNFLILLIFTFSLFIILFKTRGGI